MTAAASQGPSRVEEAAHLVAVVDLALSSATTGQLPFAALVVVGGVTVATGVNTALRDLDPLAHAEVAAVRNACRHLGTLVLPPGATIVSSCEPCAMCHAVAAVAGVDRILYAAPKEQVGDLGGPSTPAAHLDVLGRMRDAGRSAGPPHVTHVPVPGAQEPFLRFLTTAGR